MGAIPSAVWDASQAGFLRKLRANNSTQTGSFTAKNPTATAPDPTADGVIQFNLAGSWVPTRVKLVPFGVGADNATFSMRVTGWEEINGLFVPTELWEGTCTLTSSQAGVSGKSVDDSNYFCDTIVTSKGTDGVDCQPFSPANNQIAHLVLDVKGCPFIEVLFDRGGSATSANALLKLL